MSDERADQESVDDELDGRVCIQCEICGMVSLDGSGHAEYCQMNQDSLIRTAAEARAVSRNTIEMAKFLISRIDRDIDQAARAGKSEIRLPGQIIDGLPRVRQEIFREYCDRGFDVRGGGGSSVELVIGWD